MSLTAEQLLMCQCRYDFRQKQRNLMVSVVLLIFFRLSETVENNLQASVSVLIQARIIELLESPKTWGNNELAILHNHLGVLKESGDNID